MARLGTVIRLAERRGRRRAGRPGDGAMVELEAVTVRFDGRVAVDAVTASVGRGEWVGLIGANGAGKTTLLKAVAGLVDHDGEVRVGGKPSAGMGRRERARSVAYVPQSPELPADMSVFDYTLLGRTPHIAYLAVESRTDLAHCARPARSAWTWRHWRPATSRRSREASASGSCWPGRWPRRRRCC